MVGHTLKVIIFSYKQDWLPFHRESEKFEKKFERMENIMKFCVVESDLTGEINSLS
jgi:hypothetical protein